ncbi:MAG: 3-methyl-2-oxobutanoate hydroxymethyltransferase [FCB group bacterium]|nr:3-methyl-2-oxobutanoate hydroxymethyltransferase [FCB group bacterium]
MTKITIKSIKQLKHKPEPFAALTAYDFTSAQLVDKAGIPLILVGDSAAMVMLGYETTIPASLEEMLMLTAAVARGTQSALVVADMPFMSYQSSVEDAIRSAGAFIKKGLAGAVKLEGGRHMVPQISAIVDCGIPVMGHVGLTPQSFHQMSGYRIQGKTETTAQAILKDAAAVQSAGAFSIVLEGIPAELARQITKDLDIPTIGIGAGPHCDGQIQVFHDILGLGDFAPKHTRQFARLGALITDSVVQYKKEVASGKFPTPENYTHLSDSIQKTLSARGNGADPKRP